MSNTFTPAAAQKPASNTNAVATLAAPTDGTHWQLDSIRWSYSAAPTAGSKITIAWGTDSEVFYIAAGGPGSLTLNKRFPNNVGVTITLDAGGSGITGTIFCNAS